MPRASGLVFVSNTGDCTTAFPCALGTVPVGSHPDHHRDVHGAARLQRTVTDRERDRCVVDDDGHEHDEQHGDRRDDAESRCRRRGHQDRCLRPACPSVRRYGHDRRAQSGAESGDRHRSHRQPAGRVRLRVRVSEPGRVRFGNGRVDGWVARGRRNRATGPDGEGDVARRDHGSRRQDRPERAGPGHGQRLCGGWHHRDACRRISRSTWMSIATTCRWARRLTFTVRATNRDRVRRRASRSRMRCPPGSRSCRQSRRTARTTPRRASGPSAALEWTAQATLTLVARVDQPGAVVNNASVASQDQIDPNPLNDSDAESVNAAPAADLRVAKAVSDAAPGVGALVTYTIAVTNLGTQRRHERRGQRRAARRCCVRIGESITGQLRRGNGHLDTGRRAGDRDRDTDG